MRSQIFIRVNLLTKQKQKEKFISPRENENFIHVILKHLDNVIYLLQ